MLANYDSIGFWSAYGPPDAAVASSYGSYPDFGELFFDQANYAIYQCSNSAATGQTWVQYLSITQATAMIAAAAPAARSQSVQTRTLNSIYQPNASRDILANYSVNIATVLTLSGGQSGTVNLQISPSATFASGVETIGSFTNGNTGTLVVGLTLNQVTTAVLSGEIPAGFYSRLQTVNNTGTPIFTYVCGQEVLL